MGIFGCQIQTLEPLRQEWFDEKERIEPIGLNVVGAVAVCLHALPWYLVSDISRLDQSWSFLE